MSDDERNPVYAAYKEIDEAPGVTRGLRMQPLEMATTVPWRGTWSRPRR